MGHEPKPIKRKEKENEQKSDDKDKKGSKGFIRMLLERNE